MSLRWKLFNKTWVHPTHGMSPDVIKEHKNTFNMEVPSMTLAPLNKPTICNLLKINTYKPRVSSQ